MGSFLDAVGSFLEDDEEEEEQQQQQEEEEEEEEEGEGVPCAAP